MKTKEIKITPPQGYDIDKENSTFECIKFKPIEKEVWRDNENVLVKGYFIGINSQIIKTKPDCNYINIFQNYNVFATQKQAKSALAMARISQIMANDERFGGPITDEEWDMPRVKYVINKIRKTIQLTAYTSIWCFLAFHTEEQRDLFLEENEDLVRDYLMID